jgi:two-component system response regulator FlrC
MVRILVVEDDFDTRFLIRVILQAAGYQTREAESAEEALEILKNEPSIDLLLTDILMAGVNGLQLLEQSRKLFPNLPIILVSAHTQSSWVQHALQNGAACYLLKPFTRDQLVTIVTDVIGANFHLRRKVRQPALQYA